jgi:hypothetical protein
MSALAFDPWAALKRKGEDAHPAKVANPANPIPQNPPGLADLAGLAGGGPFPMREIAAVASLPAALDREVERMAEAMAANPVYRITNRETAMASFRRTL